MTTRADYSPEEWQLLLQAPVAAGQYIMLADRNFVLGSMKEILSVTTAIVNRQKQDNSELLADLLADFKDSKASKQARIDFKSRDMDDVRDHLLNILKQAAALLDEKAAPEESSEIRQWLYDLAVTTAEAAKEGGFLGIGGTRVSDDEKAALRKIAWTLGVQGGEETAG
jgi:hypothetical protein